MILLIKIAEDRQSFVSLTSFEKSHVCVQLLGSSNGSCFSLQKSLYVEYYVIYCVKLLTMCRLLQDRDSTEVQCEHKSLQRG